MAQTATLIAFLGQPSFYLYRGQHQYNCTSYHLLGKGRGTDIGLEAALLKNRLSVEADFYIKKTRQAIFDVPVLGSLGTTSSTIIANQADFQNRGFELLLTWKDNINKEWSYSVSGNVGINDNKVLSVVTGSNPIYGGGAGATSGQYTTRTVAATPN